MLCGAMLVAIPTAIPAAPLINKLGTRVGSTSGIEGLMEYITGPDFPTGGIIYGKSGIVDAYRTGKQ
jgi:DNA gyrase/topoisomerase IV subunit A